MGEETVNASEVDKLLTDVQALHSKMAASALVLPGCVPWTQITQPPVDVHTQSFSNS